jgi:hypothetical protein
LLKSENPGSVLRLPLRDYVIAEPGVPGGYGQDVQAVAASENVLNNPDVDVKVELRYSNKPDADRNYDANTFYRKGDVVLRSRKHFTAIRNTTGPFKVEDFAESYVHMPTGESGGLPSFIPEGSFTNAQPILTFNNDTDELEESTDLGNTIALVQNQIETAVDYLGLKYYLNNLGTAADPVLALADTEEERDKDVLNFLANVTTTEFRRPTNCRLFGQAYEWTGFANYSKALPQYQKELSPSNKFTYYFTNENGGKVFATGFNEEGLQVTPRGLEDITTGEVLSVTDIGNPDRDIDIPTVFPSLEVQGEFILAGKVVKNQATTSDAGATKLASFATTDVLTIAGNDDSINQNALNDGVVTPAWLNKWRIDNNILSAPDTQVFVFVDPINGMDMTIEELATSPPSRPNAAVKSLRVAVEYANTVFGPEAQVVYKLGPGAYFETGTGNQNTITFKTIAQIEAYDFDAFRFLNDSTDRGTKPFLQSGGVSNPSLFKNVNNQPTFLTPATVNEIQNSGVTQIRIRPLRLVFEQPARITGVAWYGTSQTLFAWAKNQLGAGADAYFEDFYSRQLSSPEAFTNDLKARLQALPDDSDALNILVQKCFDTPELGLPNQRRLDRIGGSLGAILFEKTGELRNVAFGAFIFVQAGEGQPGGRGVIQTRGEPLSLRGVYLIGNVKINNGFDYDFSDNSTFDLRGFSESLIYTDERNRPDDGVNVKLGGLDRNLDANFNLPWNNIHLINNNGAAATADTPATAFNDRGPVLSCFINMPGQFVLPTGVWPARSATTTGQFQGFVGAFGLLRTADDGLETQKTRGLFGYLSDLTPSEPPSGFKSVVSMATDRDSFWQQAGTGAKPELPALPIDPNPTPGAVDANVLNADFTPLNVSISLFNKGIDVQTGVSNAANLRL